MICVVHRRGVAQSRHGAVIGILGLQRRACPVCQRKGGEHVVAAVFQIVLKRRAVSFGISQRVVGVAVVIVCQVPFRKIHALVGIPGAYQAAFRHGQRGKCPAQPIAALTLYGGNHALLSGIIIRRNLGFAVD